MTTRAYRVAFSGKAWSGWSPDAAPSGPLAPRCGRVLALDGRYERAGDPGDPGRPPVCGRPADHPPAANGSPGCRSQESLERIRLAAADYQQARGNELRRLRRGAARDAWDLAAPALSARLP